MSEPTAPSSTTQEGTLNVLLVSTGYAARTFHAPFLFPEGTTPGLRLAAVLQSDSSANPAPATLFPASNIRHCKSGAEVLEHQRSASPEHKLDIAIIANANEAHCGYGMHSMLLGMHVVVEKPFTTTVESAVKFLELAKSEGRKVTVYHNRRLDTEFLTLQQLLATGQLGGGLGLSRLENVYHRSLPPGSNNH